MTIKELGRQGYAFRSRSTMSDGACVTLCDPDNRLIRVFFAADVHIGMEDARLVAIAHHVARRLES